MLSINRISFAYQKKEVLSKINFQIEKGKHLAIMGESGCGKSTLLKTIYGLFDIEKGTIYYNNEKLLGPAFHLVPGHPFMKYLSQEFNLMPYTSVAENIGEHLSNFYPLKKKKRINELLKVVDMEEYASTKVQFLSGGQQQRVAIARVLALEPEVLLLDEPFSQIDNFRKHQLRNQLFEYIKLQKITCITATHDKDDVLPFVDNILIMKNGKQLLMDSPVTIYQNKPNKYIASLLSEINVVTEGVVKDNASRKQLIFYPHELKEIIKSKHKAIVLKCLFKGDHFMLQLKLSNTLLLMKSNASKKIGDEVFLEFVLGKN